MIIEEHVPLHTLTTFGVGGPAEYFADVSTMDDLLSAIQFAHEHNYFVTVLGGGSNVLIEDTGISGLVINIRIGGVDWKRSEDGAIICVAGAGENWDNLVAETVENGMAGLENLSGIPGCVGGAPVQNIGAYGVEIKDVVEWVEAFNISTQQWKVFTPEDCDFGYRSSYFKSKEGRSWVVTKVAFRLSPHFTPHISYKDLSDRFGDGESPSLAEVRDAVLEIRAQKFPDLSEVGTAGSFFTNPLIPRHSLPPLLNDYPDLPYFEVGGDRIKISAAWLLDKACGLKGYREGKVRLYENQPLVIVAEKGATAADIIAFADSVQSKVKEATGITLSREVRILPQDSTS